MCTYDYSTPPEKVKRFFRPPLELGANLAGAIDLFDQGPTEGRDGKEGRWGEQDRAAQGGVLMWTI
jgi:hypothetical protein